jgi:hypothetical protein
MVEVFKTNVSSGEHADALSALLTQRFHLQGVSFDLEDCDRVLRVSGDVIVPHRITEALYEYGYECSVME